MDSPPRARLHQLTGQTVVMALLMGWMVYAASRRGSPALAVTGLTLGVAFVVLAVLLPLTRWPWVIRAAGLLQAGVLASYPFFRPPRSVWDWVLAGVIEIVAIGVVVRTWGLAGAHAAGQAEGRV
jgi:hypothetical protein